MSGEFFEDPLKTELRERCAIAVDAAGHELVTAPVSFPAANVVGKLRGDLQSLDGQEVRHLYYVRTDPSKAIPSWLVGFARAAEADDAMQLHLVVAARGVVLERSCKSTRVSLLLLNDDNTFEVLVDPADTDEEQIAAEFAARCKDARRRMETKLRLNTTAIEKNYSHVAEITTGMPADVREKYIEAVTVSASAWDTWSQRVSGMLDEAEAGSNDELLEAANKLIEAGADGDA